MMRYFSLGLIQEGFRSGIYSFRCFVLFLKFVQLVTKCFQELHRVSLLLNHTLIPHIDQFLCAGFIPEIFFLNFRNFDLWLRFFLYCQGFFFGILGLSFNFLWNLILLVFINIYVFRQHLLHFFFERYLILIGIWIRTLVVTHSFLHL